MSKFELIVANLPAIIGGSVAGGIVLIVASVLVLYLLKCRKDKFKDGKISLDLNCLITKFSFYLRG
jgi:hypothetical protein